ncbi:MAG: hypothetical protein QM498_05390 [Desulfobacterium sp.]
MKKFSDFAEERAILDGPKMSIEDVINKEIVITGFKTKKSKYGRNASGMCLTLQFQFVDKEEKNIVFTGSDVLIDQMEKYGEEIPFRTQIKKIDKYYTLS